MNTHTDSNLGKEFRPKSAPDLTGLRAVLQMTREQSFIKSIALRRSQTNR